MLADAPAFEKVLECASIEAVREAIKAEAPDVLILDPSLGGGAGLELIAEIKSSSDTRVLVISTFEERVYALRVLRAGAAGFLPKTATQDRIVEACERVAKRKLAFSEAVLSALVNQSSTIGGEPEEILSNRELEVFTLLGRGLSPQGISDCLSIALATVYKHVANIKEKLGVPAGSGLTHYATMWILEGRARPGSGSVAAA